MADPAKSGELRFLIRFDKKTKTEDDPAGGENFEWAEQFTRRAKIINQRGGEGVQADRLQGKQPAIIIVRYDSETVLIEPDWRAVRVVDGEAREIYALKTAVDMEMDRKFITMQAVIGDADS